MSMPSRMIVAAALELVTAGPIKTYPALAPPLATLDYSRVLITTVTRRISTKVNRADTKAAEAVELGCTTRATTTLIMVDLEVAAMSGTGTTTSSTMPPKPPLCSMA